MLAHIMLLAAIPQGIPRDLIRWLNYWRNNTLVPFLTALGVFLGVVAVFYILFLLYKEFRHSTRRV